MKAVIGLPDVITERAVMKLNVKRARDIKSPKLLVAMHTAAISFHPDSRDAPLNIHLLNFCNIFLYFSSSLLTRLLKTMAACIGVRRRMNLGWCEAGMRRCK